MAELSILTPKRSMTKSVQNLQEKQKGDARERKKNILYLIYSYLMEQNLCDTAEALTNEAQLNEQCQVCENVDLDIILQEYQSYYFTKFQKYPKIVRKLDSNEVPQKVKRKPALKPRKVATKEATENLPECDDFQFGIVSLSNNNSRKSSDSFFEQPLETIEEIRSPEWKEMAEVMMKEFINNNTKTSWGDCIGLSSTAEKLKEAITYPLIYPDLFSDTRTWRGILLFGPPGTGKTLLAKALASEGCTFINVTSSTFISKWRGESEKMVKVLFDLAKKHAPTTIFIDEVDALMSTVNQHEASRRFKSELLTQIDGIQGSTDHVFVLGSTNVPWNLDTAMLRRFEKRIYVPLPDDIARVQLLKLYINGPNSLEDKEWFKLGGMIENFSGSDIKCLSIEVKMRVIREKIKEIDAKGTNRAGHNLRKVTLKDVEDSLAKIRPCVTCVDVKRFEEWNEKFGSY
ncbi:unnamed protein product [Acanthoscelides obtectus]|uniref:AAA+ ATPase domain-containing protein n=1 Tax=Acanthoscelides obtectus TaxID=200917 RepID=A0A9P0PHV9_ACAOB|nr:unnamed protein product [Acanthoscelides obtectus]CAK1678197.1 Katanin p60 ATPase-containing subunit A1 [Acanthoscelides obtectus]